MPEPGGLYYTEEGELDRRAVDLTIGLQAAGLAVFQLLETALQRPVFVTTPAAGAEWVTTVPAGSTWELLSVNALFTASAVVASRTPSLNMRDADGNTLARWSAAGSLAASASGFIGWFAGLGDHSSSFGLMAPLPSPPIVVQSSWTLRTVTASLDVGDTWTQISLIVREWSPGRVSRYLRFVLADLDASGGLV